MVYDGIFFGVDGVRQGLLQKLPCGLVEVIILKGIDCQFIFKLWSIHAASPSPPGPSEHNNNLPLPLKSRSGYNVGSWGEEEGDTAEIPHPRQAVVAAARSAARAEATMSTTATGG